MQTRLSELQCWSDQWQLTISYKKCSVSLLNNVKGGHHANLVLGDKEVSQPDCVKDLGVLTDQHLKFEEHINHTVTRANRVANLIHKCFISKDLTTLMKAYTTYVRPIMEYASCIWSPHTVGLTKKIESVQRRFTKRLPCCCDLTYSERLAKLQLHSLELRRLRFDLIYAYNIIFGILETDVFFFTISSTNNFTRGHNLKLLMPQSRIDVRKYFFACRNCALLE